MPRYGDVDYRPLEQMRRLLTTASETYLQNQRSRVAMERELMSRGAINSILQSTASAIQPKLEEGPVAAPGPATEAGQPALAPGLVEKPLDSQTRNRVIDEAALRVASIPGGERIASFLHQYREPVLSPYQLAQLGLSGERLDLSKAGLELAKEREKRAREAQNKREAATGDLYIRDKDGILHVRQDVSPARIQTERNRIRDDLRKMREDKRKSQATYGYLQRSNPELAQEMYGAYNDPTIDTDIEYYEELYDALLRSAKQDTGGGGKKDRTKPDKW